MIYYVDVHNERVVRYTVAEFLYLFNSDELDTARCEAYEDEEVASDRLMDLIVEG
jgi:hypothetical protein